jgi:sensor histidine kinase YesM
MPYYPKSQIKTNLYTNGGELVYVLNLEPYKGYYYQTSDGKYFSGQTPNTPASQELILDTLAQSSPQVEIPLSYVNYTQDSLNYINIINPNLSPIQIPVYIPTLPTQQDYQIGTFRRYFCKKTNEIIYIEINKNTFDKLISKDPQILWQLYFPFDLLWTLTGDKQQVAKTNRNITLLAQQQFNLPKLNLYLKEDYLKYYLET